MHRNVCTGTEERFSNRMWGYYICPPFRSNFGLWIGGVHLLCRSLYLSTSIYLTHFIQFLMACAYKSHELKDFMNTLTGTIILKKAPLTITTFVDLDFWPLQGQMHFFYMQSSHVNFGFSVALCIRFWVVVLTLVVILFLISITAMWTSCRICDLYEIVSSIALALFTFKMVVTFVDQTLLEFWSYGQDYCDSPLS